MKKQNQQKKNKNFSDSVPTVTPKISHYHRYYCFCLLHHRFQQLLKMTMELYIHLPSPH